MLNAEELFQRNADVLILQQITFINNNNKKKPLPFTEKCAIFKNNK